MLALLGTIAAGAAAGTVARGSVSQCGFDGVMLRFADYESAMRCSLKVTLYTPEGSEVLCNAPTLFLSERSDYKGGQSFSEAYRLGTDTGVPAETEFLAGVSVFVDLGHTELSGEDEVEATCTVVTALEADGGVRMSAVDFGPGPETTKQIIEKPTGVANFSFASEAWAYRTPDDANEDAVAELTADQATFSVKLGSRSYSFDGQDAYGLTAALGQFGGQGTRRTLNLFIDGALRNPSGEASITVTGSDKANWTLFGVERLAFANRAPRKAAELAAVREAGIKKAALRQPEKLVALRQAGQL